MNFLSLACDQEIQADYYAFSDQDDVWLSNKLEMALSNILKNQDIGLPYVYCGRTTYVDENMKLCGLSKEFNLPKTFNNALVHSVAGGNTMVFNTCAKNWLVKFGMQPVASHDWWLYQISTGIGGKLFYDSQPYVFYRQHTKALIGGNTNLSSKFKRVVAVLNGRFKKYNDQNIKALLNLKKELSDDAQKSLEKFNLLRNACFIQRLLMLNTCEVYRQTIWQTRIMKFAILFKLA
jgi:hypothetical protein